MRNIFVDMDGVLANFDAHYHRHFGERLKRWPGRDKTDWRKVASVPNFFLTIPPMDDARELLDGIRPRPYKVLTGVSKEIDTCSNHKVDWIAMHVRPTPPVICCRARDKCLHGRPGDVLIDDYLKYRGLWEGMGGIFIHHTSAAESLRLLNALDDTITLRNGGVHFPDRPPSWPEVSED